MTEVRFSNGKYYLRDNAVWSADGKRMTKVSSSTSSSSSTSTSTNSSSYQSGNSYSGSDSYSNNVTSFRNPSDVFSYLSGKTFYGGGVSLRISSEAAYLDGYPISGAPTISNISSSSATIRVRSPYLGGDEFRFYLNANNGSISMESGEKLYLR